MRLRYYSMLDGGGYCIAGAMLVRALVNAGVEVQWVPLLFPADSSMRPVRLDVHAALNSPFVAVNHAQAAWLDLPALLRATARPVAADQVILHTVPELWPDLMEPGLRNIGHTVWETNRLPTHWVPLCNALSALIVPCAYNRDVFVGSGCRLPVHVLPHVRRSYWYESNAAELRAMRAQLQLREEAFTFYSINTWDIRKNMERLISAFATAFTADQAVQLLIKTSDYADQPMPPYTRGKALEYAPRLLEALQQQLGRPLPQIRLLADALLPQNQMDCLHRLGDCFVSMSHGEGWGLGAFEAASYGNPVLAARWNGLCDFFPPDWQGALPMQHVAVPIWPPHRPSYWGDQRWAEISPMEAAQAMQRAVQAWPVRLHEAQQLQATLSDRYSEARVAALLMQILGS